MKQAIQKIPLFVPLQNAKPILPADISEDKLILVLKASIVSFLIGVTVLSMFANSYERELRLSQQNTCSSAQSTNK